MFQIIFFSNEFKKSFQNIIKENTISQAKDMKQQYFLLESLNDIKQKEIIEKYKNFMEKEGFTINMARL